MEIAFKPETVRKSGTTTISGRVWFEFWTNQFPGALWSDFVVVLATWWLDEVRRLCDGADRGQLDFMEGPYSVRLQRLPGDEVALHCVESSSDGGVVHIERVRLEELLALVHRFARSVSSTCSRLGLESRDTDALNRSLAAADAATRPAKG